MERLPAPVVDRDSHRGVGRRRRGRRYIRLALIGRHRFPVESASVVLSSHYGWVAVALHQRTHRMQNFDLLVTHRVGGERARRLHRSQSQQLQQVVLKHVSQDTGFFVVLAATLDAYRFRGGNLHVRDVMAIPQRLENGVAEAEHQNVLDALFAEVVIDAVDLVLSELIEHEPVQRHRGLEAVAEGFSMTTRTQGRLICVRPPRQLARAEMFQSRLEYTGRDRQVEQSAPILLRRPVFDLLQALLDVGVGNVLVKSPPA